MRDKVTATSGNLAGYSELAEPEDTGLLDPRALLAEWANANDEWVRLLVAEVIASARPVDESTVEKAYWLFRQERALDKRELPVAPQLSVVARQDESAPPLTLTRLSEVYGVNALAPGSVIEPHEGLTILYGENGTGKTGYSRVFKALANSRTADTILSDIEADSVEGLSAKVEFRVGEHNHTHVWSGERGVSPFMRMSIFDSPGVTTHVDDDLDYVYVPAALALFKHVTAAIQAVTGRIDSAISALGSGSPALLLRFHRGSTVYPLIETLGASSDLADLKLKTKAGEASDRELDSLTQAVAALSANTIGVQITALRSQQRVLTQAVAAVEALTTFDQAAYDRALTKRTQLAKDQEAFRSELFAAVDLPAAPDDTWNDFIEGGESYRQHLIDLEVHDIDRCLYCRQPLLEPARDLLTRYSTYLEDKISADIRTTDTALDTFKRQILSIQSNEMTAFIEDNKGSDEADRPAYFVQVEMIEDTRRAVATALSHSQLIDITIAELILPMKSTVAGEETATRARVTELENQQQDREKALEEKQVDLLDLKDAVELGKSWSLIEGQIKDAKEADRLRTLKKAMPQVVRAVTELSKNASNLLINQNFGALFLEECEILRTPPMKLQFVGRDGRAQRRKIMTGKHKPSKVLSEGEQKVLALADFLAEARLAGVTAPVIFDDPVSSLDHRRVNEVAQRIARLADNNQVIVFTHDILFATTLLALFEESKRCAYFQITDENGKGKVVRATGPRWDTLSGIRGKINSTIEAANHQEGETREALVRVGYGWLRSWCEVFTETEILQGVTQRYQPNVGMARLPKIKTDKLGTIIPKVSEVFEDACRYIDGHSQPLVTLGVSPTLTSLEQQWAELQEIKKLNDGKL